MMRKEYMNYIFDLYGTLIDIRTDEQSFYFWKKVSDLFASYGKSYEPEQLHQKYLERVNTREQQMRKDKGYDLVEITIENVFRDLLEPVKADDGEINKICRTFRKLSIMWCYPYDNTLKVLRELKRRGKRVYMLSNAQNSFTEDDLSGTGIPEMMDRMYISSVEGIKKPHPDFIGKLIRENDLKPEECVMIGNDMRTDIMSAQIAGIDSVFLNTYAMSKEYIRDFIREHALSDNIEIIMDGEIGRIINEE